MTACVYSGPNGAVIALTAGPGPGELALTERELFRIGPEFCRSVILNVEAKGVLLFRRRSACLVLHCQSVGRGSNCMALFKVQFLGVEGRFGGVKGPICGF